MIALKTELIAGRAISIRDLYRSELGYEIDIDGNSFPYYGWTTVDYL